MANQMNLLKLRSWEAHDEINLYSTAEGSLTKGTIVEYSAANPDNHNGFGDTLSNVPGYAFSKDYIVNWKVTAASAYSKKIAGMLLYDVITTMTDPWSVDARFVDPAKLAEKQMVVSGRAVPFVTRGFFEISGFDMSSGSAGPGPGTGLCLSHSGAGLLATYNPAGDVGDLRPRLGTFMSSTGANGGAYVRFAIPNH